MWFLVGPEGGKHPKDSLCQFIVQIPVKDAETQVLVLALVVAPVLVLVGAGRPAEISNTNQY